MTDPMLTNTQEDLLARLRNGGATPEDLAAGMGENGDGPEPDAVRKALTRLMTRDLVRAGEGRGVHRVYMLSEDGRSVINERRPPVRRAQEIRAYKVLEPMTLAALVETVAELGLDPTQVAVYWPHGPFDSRNAEHALRQAGKALYDAGRSGEFPLAAVADRFLQVEPVNVKADITVSIG